MSVPHDQLLSAIAQLTASRARETAARELATLAIDFLPASEAEVFELDELGGARIVRSVAVAGRHDTARTGDDIREEWFVSEFPGLERCLSQGLPWRLGREATGERGRGRKAVPTPRWLR